MIELTIQQAAKILGCSESTVRRMEENGKLVSLKTEKGHRRFDFFAVNALREEGKEMPVRVKLSLDGIKIKDLKKAVSNFDDNDVVDMVIEEYHHPSLRSLGLYSENHFIQIIL